MDWSKINDTIFEAIACSYAQDNYKNYTWIPTSQSWDGNKDAYFKSAITSLNLYFKGWCEAKFTINPDKSIPKSHMDSTLVSGILDGEVIFILFVTNGRITKDFMQRATAILKPHRIDVKFVEGSNLVKWLKTRQDIIDTYFDCGLIEDDENKANISIIDICFLEKISSSSALISPIRKLYLNQDYFLYLNIYAEEQINIKLISNIDAIKAISQEENEFLLTPGYNSFFIKYRTMKIYNGDFYIFVKNENGAILTQNSYSIIIENSEKNSLVFSAQQRINQELYDMIKLESEQNIIFDIEGPGGTGKSYLLNNLVTDLADNHNEILVLNFSEKKAENATLLCKLILFINFGFLYELSDEAFRHLTQSYPTIYDEMLTELREGTLNQINALNVINKLCNILFNNCVSLIPNKNSMIHRHPVFIIIEDLHKISCDFSILCKNILDEFSTKSFSQKMIISNRPNEYYSKELEQEVMCLQAKRFSLPPLSINDVFSSIQYNFNTSIAKLAKHFTTPVSILHLDLLIQQLKKINILNSPKEKRAIAYSEAYKNTNISNSQFIISKIRSCKYLEILFIIYKIESGIPVDFLISYYKDKFKKSYRYLLNNYFVKQERDLLMPYHDTYIYAFMSIHFSSEYFDNLNEFLLFCLNNRLDETNSELISNMLSILISKDNIERFNYLDTAKIICKKYYVESKYLAAKILALELLPDLDTTPYYRYCYDDLEMLYIFAQSEKYSQTHVDSTKSYNLIIHIGEELSLSQKEMGIIHEIHSELITNYLYTLNLKKFESELKYFEKNIKNKVTKESSEHMINAYLNYLNRYMIYSFFKDNSIEEIDKLYRFALEESKRLNRKDYEAYAYMDYAKILIGKKNKYSMELLERALPIFNSLKECKKREIDCQAGIYFIKSLKNGIHPKLYELQQKALKNNYIHVYARITLIILTLELYYDFSPEIIESKLTDLLIKYTDLNKINRLSIYVNQIYSAIYFKLDEFDLQIKYAKKQLKLADLLCYEYTVIPKQNMRKFESKKIGWYFIDEVYKDELNNVFLFDPKIW